MIRNILAIDGGGIRGVIAARVLVRLEERLQELSGNPEARIADYFDFIVGASGGGLIGSLALMPQKDGISPCHSAKQTEEIYIESGGIAFALNKVQRALRGHRITSPKYSGEPIEKVFQKHCGDVKLSQLIKPYLSTAYDMLGNECFLFRQYRARHNPAENFYMRDLCRAISSAPTYFPPAEISSIAKKEYLFVDGGIYSRNPALLAYAEIRRLFPDASAKHLNVLSLGGGFYREQYEPKEIKKWGKLEWAAPLVELMSDIGVIQGHEQMKAIFHDSPEGYLRLDPILPDEKTDTIDLATEENVGNLIELTENYLRAMDRVFNDFARRLIAGKEQPQIATGTRIMDLRVEPYWRHNYPPDTPPFANTEVRRNLAELVEIACAENTERVACEEFGCKTTYTQVHRHYNHLAAWLQTHSQLKKGDRVGIMMPNCSQYLLSVYAALAAGGAVVNINPLYTAEELTTILRISRPKVLIVWSGALKIVNACPKELVPQHLIVTGLGDMLSPLKRVLIHLVLSLKGKQPVFGRPPGIGFRTALRQGAKCSFYHPHIAAEDMAFLQFTGGTTGEPKAVVLTHRNMVANVAQCYAHVSRNFCDSTEEQRVTLTALPLYHIFALTVNGIFFFHIGAHNVLVANPRDINGLIKTMKKYTFHGIDGVNTLFKAMLAHPQFATLDFSKLILALGGGMAVHPKVAADWKKATGVLLKEGYGLTEASPVITINPYDQKEFNGSIGLPVPSTLAVILDEKTLTPVSTGNVGLLFVRGPQVMAGYWENPEATAKDLSTDGWLNTGDIGYMDDKGYIYLVDRAKDVILVSGFNVYPSEIEKVLDKHPAVAESGCIGIKNEQDDEEIVAFIVPKKGEECTAEALLKHCRGSLTAYKIPDRIVFADVLPKSPVGKILRKDLPKLLNPPPAAATNSKSS